MSLIRQFIKDCLTERDGVSFDVARILFVIGVLCFLGLAIYDVIRLKHAFDGGNFGGGLGGLLGGGGLGIGARSKMEGSA